MPETFGVEDQLPNLLVPSLETTIEKYLYSVKAVASEEEYKRTEEICKHFINNEGKLLQNELKKREKVHRNWVEELWTDKGYLEFRPPLHFLNFAGAASYQEQFWPMEVGTQTERAAMDLLVLFQFWTMLHTEVMKPHTDSKGKYFSMHQLRTMYNTTRIPKRHKDEIATYFKTTSEGKAPTHVIILHQDTPYTPPQLHKALNRITERSESLGKSPGFASLTALDRDTWADIRHHVTHLSERNSRNLQVIDSAIHVLSLDDAQPSDYGAMLHEAMCGDPAQRWRDKSYNSMWSKNGVYYASSDHTTFDGMIMVVYNQFSTMKMTATDGKWNGPVDLDTSCEFEELNFDLDQKTLDAIKQGKANGVKFRNDIKVLCPTYEGVGKLELKQLTVYPDAFVQICLQLAYMRMHGKPASTYETATTRSFYHGRTETCRTCIPELVEFCRACIAGEPPRTVQSLLQKAHDNLVWLMRECQDNKGCDRHLFGLATVAAEKGIPLPEIFTEPMYNKTGGNANFVLSTSFVGFYHSSGAAVPMVEDGYGVFYRMNDHRIIVTIITWNYSSVTDANAFQAQVEKAIDDVIKVFRSCNNAVL